MYMCVCIWTKRPAKKYGNMNGRCQFVDEKNMSESSAEVDCGLGWLVLLVA